MRVKLDISVHLDQIQFRIQLGLEHKTRFVPRSLVSFRGSELIA